ncbi:MAG: hypothetical protein HZA77_00965 [Candidatus Schekmanbacteria bacterium]|nr:hypothetical protein [Candidatus Schekmanbacteria bacterium]
METYITSFKKCPLCEVVWDSREEFLKDPRVSVIGYQTNFKKLGEGFFLFNHDSCGTSLAIMVDAFHDFYKGPIYEDRATGSEDCPGYCLHQSELRRCPAKCECAYVREIIQIVSNWTKD